MVDEPEGEPAASEPTLPIVSRPPGGVCVWQSLLLLGRGVRLGLRTRLFMPAALGVFLTFLGWWCIAWMFSATDDALLNSSLKGFNGCPLTSGSAMRAPSAPELADKDKPAPASDADKDAAAAPRPSNSFLLALREGPRVPVVWDVLSRPVRLAFRPDATYQTLAFSILATLWVTAVWAFFGGGIVRMAAMELTREEKISWKQAFGHALRKWQSLFAAPLFPLFGVLLFGLPTALVGLLGHTNVGLFLASLIAPVLLIGGLLSAIFVIGLWFGWPLMIAAISTESSDSFDGLSRAFSYVYQRSLHLLGYLVVAVVLNLLAMGVAIGFSEMVIYLAGWSFSWGMGDGPA